MPNGRDPIANVPIANNLIDRHNVCREGIFSYGLAIGNSHIIEGFRHLNWCSSPLT
jgi:hypothetical protein